MGARDEGERDQQPLPTKGVKVWRVCVFPLSICWWLRFHVVVLSGALASR